MSSWTDIKLNSAASAIKRWREKTGFYTPPNIHGPHGADMLGKLMLVTTEVAEAAEAVRDADEENFEEELADIIIRLLDIAATCDIDLELAIINKMEVNELREIRHGRKSEL